MDKFFYLLPGLLFLLVISFGLAQIVIGFLGIEYHLGFYVGVVFLILAFVFRFMLPLTIGAYFGAVDVLGWEWYMALIFALPGILLMFPVLIMGLFSSISDKRY